MSTDYVEGYTDLTPARVHIVQDDTKTPQQAYRKFRNVISKTYLAGVTPELILPRSAGRRCAYIQVIGVVGTQGNVILCDNQADAGQAVTFVTEAGTIAGAALQPGMFITVEHNDEVWLARLGSAGTPPLVSVIAENEA